MRKRIARVAAAGAVLAATAALVPMPTAAFDLEVVSVIISPVAARSGER